MLKKVLSTTAIAASVVLLSGCGSSIPKPAQEKEKPTVFIESKTVEKFKDLTEENADARGISSLFVKDKQYLKCDMLPETVATFAKQGFDVIHDKQKADYTVDITLLSCGQGVEYFEHRNANPSKSKDFYKYNIEQAQKYLQRTNGIVLPNKYYKIPDEDKKVLENYFKGAQIASSNTNIVTSTYMNGVNQIGGSAGQLGLLNSTSGAGANAAKTLGGASVAMGLISVIGSVRNPEIYNEFKIIKNSSGKAWSRTIRTVEFTAQDWRSNIDKPILDWTVDEIPWGELE